MLLFYDTTPVRRSVGDRIVFLVGRHFRGVSSFLFLVS